MLGESLCIQTNVHNLLYLYSIKTWFTKTNDGFDFRRHLYVISKETRRGSAQY